MSSEKRKALVVDAEVLVYNPESIKTLRKGGNILYIPWAVLLELEQLRGKPESRLEADEAAIRIEEIRNQQDGTLRVFQNPSFTNLDGLNRKLAKHHVIAAARDLQTDMQKNRGKRGCQIDFAAVEIVSREPIVRILAGELKIVAKDYLSDQVPVKEYRTQEIRVPANWIQQDYFPYREEFGKVEQNEGVICVSDRNPTGLFRNSFAAIRKGDLFKIISPEIEAAGIRPYSLNGNGPNWYQYIALEQLLDPEVELVFLQGGAGSGKTLLALASAIEQKNRYGRIVITRPMVHLEDEDNMGFLPGGVDEKMSPWLRPITQNLNLLRTAKNKGGDDQAVSASRGFPISGGNKIVKKKRNAKEKTGANGKNGAEGADKYGKIDFIPLDYIRGTTFHRTLLIIDEAQNLTPHQVKTIITRAGERTKIILTGDLGQIDRRKMLSERSNGLAYGIATMNGLSAVGVTTFKETVRSALASLAEERM